MTHYLNDEELVRRFRAGEEVSEIARRYQCSTETVRRRLRPLVGPLPHGGNRRGGAVAIGGRAASIQRDVGAAEVPPPCDPKLSPLDADVIATGGTWAGRAAIAKKHAVPMGVVESRFHRLRVSA